MARSVSLPRSTPATVGRLKALLPTHAYLHLLHQGVMTGVLPRFTPEGKPTSQFDNLSPRDRADLARYLIDKVVPDAPKELALVASAPEGALTPADVVHLSSDELRRLASSSPETELPDVNAPLESIPTPAPVPAGAGAA